MSCPDLAALAGIPCENNAPGYLKMYAVKTADVDTLPAPGANHTITADIILAAGKAFVEWYFTPSTGKFTEVMEGEVDGESWKPQFEMFIPKDRPQVAQWKKSLKGQDLLLILQDANGQYKVLGDLDRPCRMFEPSTDSGAGGTDRGGTTVMFRTLVNLPEPVPFYTGAIDITV